MSVTTFEGVVEAGQIRLLSGEILPENAKVYVLIPDYDRGNKEKIYNVTLPAQPRVVSPRLVKRDDSKRFRMTVSPASEKTDAGV